MVEYFTLHSFVSINAQQQWLQKLKKNLSNIGIWNVNHAILTEHCYCLRFEQQRFRFVPMLQQYTVRWGWLRFFKHTESLRHCHGEAGLWIVCLTRFGSSDVVNLQKELQIDKFRYHMDKIIMKNVERLRIKIGEMVLWYILSPRLHKSD